MYSILLLLLRIIY